MAESVAVLLSFLLLQGKHSITFSVLAITYHNQQKKWKTSLLVALNIVYETASYKIINHEW